ncbi:MAG: GTP-binding protein [Proteobacteria bacterium]|nr:GTP-binding protein [Pseudomonadota bacterium]
MDPKQESNESKKDVKTKLLLVSGFLGAGKTTLLKHVLSWKRDMSDTVVIVNEFGDIGIDGSLLKGEASDIVELTSGCICCTLVSDLTFTLRKIWADHNPRWIIVEASGIADPKTIVQAFQRDEIMSRVEFLKTVTVLDGDFWEMRTVMGQFFSNQLETADLLLFNKIDLLDKEKAAKSLEEVREFLPQTQIIPTVHCGIDPDLFYTEAPNKDWREDESLFTHDASPEFSTFSFSHSSPLNKAFFTKFIDELPKEIFRAKGTVHFEDSNLFLNFVTGKQDWTSWEGDPETRLVFIGWNPDEDAILHKLAACVAA